MDTIKTPDQNNAVKNSILRKVKRARFLVLFVIVAITATATFSATTSASSLDKFLKTTCPLLLPMA
jgi:hypothetical protein